MGVWGAGSHLVWNNRWDQGKDDVSPANAGPKTLGEGNRDDAGGSRGVWCHRACGEMSTPRPAPGGMCAVPELLFQKSPQVSQLSSASSNVKVLFFSLIFQSDFKYVD